MSSDKQEADGTERQSARPSNDMSDFGDSGEKDEYVVLKYLTAHVPDTYRPFILSKWLRSFRYGAPILKQVPSDIFYVFYGELIDKLLKKRDSFCRMAVLADDHDVILGFSVTRFQVLDYIYVHKDCRRQGIARSLLPGGIKYVTHLTKLGHKIMDNNPKYDHLSFNLFA